MADVVRVKAASISEEIMTMAASMADGAEAES